ncbi:MAG TPA: GNAT family N-acetyltransferase [Acidobacteriaceae bacterium]|jgi:GNAT superfamily N-acetyltransferase
MSTQSQDRVAQNPVGLNQPSSTIESDNVNYFLRVRGELIVSTDPGDLDLDVVFAFLTDAKWWTELTVESLERALRNSLCFSLREGNAQIGFARVISDFVTYAYLCDVYVAKEGRGRGLGSWLMHCVLEHPDLKNLKRVSLITHDAQDFYLGLDFCHLPHTTHYMERLR